jgi:hypothetical protein
MDRDIILPRIVIILPFLQYHWSMMRVRLPIISGPVQVMSKLIMNENTFSDHRKDGRSCGNLFVLNQLSSLNE